MFELVGAYVPDHSHSIIVVVQSQDRESTIVIARRDQSLKLISQAHDSIFVIKPNYINVAISLTVQIN